MAGERFWSPALRSVDVVDSVILARPRLAYRRMTHESLRLQEQGKASQRIEAFHSQVSKQRSPV